jgi:sporulation protein YlmC with PRC-barrel domain
MGFNRPTWQPGRGHKEIMTIHSRRVTKLRQAREQRAREAMATRSLEGSLISLAALLGTDVVDSAGASTGKLRDAIVHWTASAPYPPLTAVVVRTGRRDVEIGARWIELWAPNSVRLRSTAAYARAVERHPADVGLAHDVLDRQIVDIDGVQLVRPSDVYLATVNGRVELVGIEIGVGALFRRLGPKRVRARCRPKRVIDWATIRAFTPRRDVADRSAGRRSRLAGQAGTGLMLDSAGGEVRRLRASDIEAALHEAQADLVSESR